jgi:hypothetical protein
MKANEKEADLAHLPSKDQIQLERTKIICLSRLDVLTVILRQITNSVILDF